MTERREFTAKIKAAAYYRADKRCERCGCFLKRPQYNHRIPDAMGGEPTLENCEVLCAGCHGEQTCKTDVPMIAKSKRIRAREAGVRKPRSIVSWRKFSGEIVRRPRER
jgi:5-methylcytosine-specific restriction protein A